MRIRDAVGSFVGAVVVYAVMAACGSTHASVPATDAPSGAASSSSSAGGGGLIDAIAEDVMSPVPDAKADPTSTPPDVAVEQCNKSTGTITYAEHVYPGASATELALSVVAIGTLAVPGPAAVRPPGYDATFTRESWVKDGAVAFYCGQAGNPGFTGVTFVRRAN